MEKTLWKETFKIWLFTLVRIPLVFWLRPRMIRIDDESIVVKMPLNRRTKNHVGSMYFGALAVGAEIGPGILALHLFKKHNAKCTFIFKDFHAEFIKRAEGDVYFLSHGGDKISAAIQKALSTQERQHITVNIDASCPEKTGEDIIARFSLTISLKCNMK